MLILCCPIYFSKPIRSAARYCFPADLIGLLLSKIHEDNVNNLILKQNTPICSSCHANERNICLRFDLA